MKRYTIFCSVKDKIPAHQKPNVIYTIKFPECDENYVRKTERCVTTTLNEHRNRSDLPTF